MRNRIFTKLIQGVIVGFAFISGMGGGTVAVLIGIYDDLVSGIADFNTNPRKSIAELWPWVVGAIIGVIALIFPISLALKHFPIPTTALIVGLTLGGFREITKFTAHKSNIKNLLLALLAFLIAVGVGVVSWYSQSAGTLATFGFKEAILAFLIGVVESAAIVAPGISGTQFLLAIGYFGAVLGLATNLLQGINLAITIGLIVIILVGFIIGVILVSKMMKFFLLRYRIPTYFVLLGFILGSVVACFFNGDIKEAYSVFSGWPPSATWIILASVILLVVGFVVSFFLLKYVEQKQPVENNNESEQ